jgi:tetratricopeptide (TPR) repeat protein
MRLKSFHLLFLIGLLAFTYSCRNREGKCDEFYAKYQAVVAKMNGNKDTLTLIRTLDKIVLDNPKCVDALLTRGDLLFSIDSSFKAISNYKRALSVDTGNVYAAYRLGMAYELEEMYDSAIFFFQKAINRKSIGNGMMDYPDKLQGLSDDRSKYDIESTELMYRQGLCFYYKKDLQNAYDNFNFCILHYYMLEESYLYRGSLYFQTNQTKKGCNDFLEAKKLGNVQADAYLDKYCK